MRLFHLIPFIFCFLFSNGQNSEYCASDYVLSNWLNTHSSSKSEFLNQQNNTGKLDSLLQLKNSLGRTTSAVVYTIPVVFHILHLGGPENISDLQVMDALNILNRDFRKLNPDTVNIIPQFKSLAADVNFEFRLATKDTNGNCTTGIVRHYDSNTYNWPLVPNPAFYKYTWNTNSIKYLNIYVVKKIAGATGYAYLPGTSPDFMNVVVIENTSLGSIGNVNPVPSRVLTHEVGHWFNLLHTFDSGQFGVICGDDGVSDTPITKGFSSCPSGSPALCNSTVIENYQNYMDYSSCRCMFTSGQVTRMTNAISSPVGHRNSLWTNPNLIATGVINPLTNCSPIADFYLNPNTTCNNQIVNLNDISYNGLINSWSWSSSGGATISSPTTSNSTILFPTPGIYTISLTASNSSGSSTTTKTISVLPNSADIGTTYHESFESIGLPQNFNIISSDTVTWRQTVSAAASGSKSYYIDGSQNPPGEIDIFETPSYDFLNNPGAQFTFKYAYAKLNSSNADVLSLETSYDCGGSWATVFQLSSAVMAQNSGGVSNTPYFPAPFEFVTFTLSSLPSFYTYTHMSSVRIRFSFKEDPTAGYGNNIFIDDINFDSDVTGINELTKYLQFQVYPNPSSYQINLDFVLSSPSRISYNITTVFGQKIQQDLIMDLSQGRHVLPTTEKLNTGIYFLNFQVNGQTIVRKIIIE